MGVFKFFGDWVKIRFPLAITPTTPSDVAGLAIDLNGLLHSVASKIYQYGKDIPKEEWRIRQNTVRTNMNLLAVDFVRALGNELTRILDEIRPKEYLIIAVDGIAPVAKMQQQKQRRYKAAALRYQEGQAFDNAVFTTGTEYMRNIDLYLRDWLEVHRDIIPPLTIYSSHLVPGEGEHKIMQYYRETINHDLIGAHVIYGMDADFILLSSVNPLKNIYLKRERRNEVLSIDAMWSYLKNSISSHDDFMVITFLVGNDFIPHQLAFTDMLTTIDTLVDKYKELGVPLTDNNGIIWETYSLFLQEIAKLEPQLLGNLYSQEDSPAIIAASVKDGEFNYNVFRKSWYDVTLGARGKYNLDAYVAETNSIREQCENYFNMIHWCYNYYKGKPINKEWFYRYHFAPLLTDLSDYSIQMTKGPVMEDVVFNINPLDQLVSVLPTASIDLLPLEVRNLANPFSPIGYLYPEKFSVEVLGYFKGEANYGVSLIPFVDIVSVVEAIDDLHLERKVLDLFDKGSDRIIKPNEEEVRAYYESLFRPKLAENLIVENRVTEFRGTQLSHPIGRGVQYRGRGTRGSPSPRGRGRGRGNPVFQPTGPSVTAFAGQRNVGPQAYNMPTRLPNPRQRIVTGSQF